MEDNSSTGTESYAAAMIRRFRTSKPTSKAERQVEPYRRLWEEAGMRVDKDINVNREMEKEKEKEKEKDSLVSTVGSDENSDLDVIPRSYIPAMHNQGSVTSVVNPRGGVSSNNMDMNGNYRSNGSNRNISDDNSSGNSNYNSISKASSILQKANANNNLDSSMMSQDYGRKSNSRYDKSIDLGESIDMNDFINQEIKRLEKEYLNKEFDSKYSKGRDGSGQSNANNNNNYNSSNDNNNNSYNNKNSNAFRSLSNDKSAVKRPIDSFDLSKSFNLSKSFGDLGLSGINNNSSINRGGDASKRLGGSGLLDTSLKLEGMFLIEEAKKAIEKAKSVPDLTKADSSSSSSSSSSGGDGTAASSNPVLNEVNKGLEDLMQSLHAGQDAARRAQGLLDGSDGKSIDTFEPATITEIGERLEHDMAGFIGYYDALQAEEEAARAERKRRDDEMREAGRAEEREKQSALLSSKIAESETKNTVHKVVSLDMINRHPLFQDNKIIAETIDQEFMMASNVMKEIRHLRHTLRHRLENAEGYQDQIDGLDIFHHSNSSRANKANALHLATPSIPHLGHISNASNISATILNSVNNTQNNSNTNTNTNTNYNSNTNSKHPNAAAIEVKPHNHDHISSVLPNRQAASMMESDLHKDSHESSTGSKGLSEVSKGIEASLHDTMSNLHSSLKASNANSNNNSNSNINSNNNNNNKSISNSNSNSNSSSNINTNHINSNSNTNSTAALPVLNSLVNSQSKEQIISNSAKSLVDSILGSSNSANSLHQDNVNKAAEINGNAVNNEANTLNNNANASASAVSSIDSGINANTIAKSNSATNINNPVIVQSDNLKSSSSIEEMMLSSVKQDESPQLKSSRSNSGIINNAGNNDYINTNTNSNSDSNGNVNSNSNINSNSNNSIDASKAASPTSITQSVRVVSSSTPYRKELEEIDMLLGNEPDVYLSPTFKSSKGIVNSNNNNININSNSSILRGGYASMNTNHSIIVPSEVFSRYQLNHSHNPPSLLINNDSKLLNDRAVLFPPPLPSFSSPLSPSNSIVNSNSFSNSVPRITLTGAAASFIRSSNTNTNTNNNKSTNSNINNSKATTSISSASPTLIPSNNASFNERESFLKAMQAKRRSYI